MGFTNTGKQLKAKKSFGQHFLKEGPIAERIAKSLIEEGPKEVLEVGPGMGMLTQYLLQEDWNLKAVEADNDMVSYLAQHYPQLPVFGEDFLKLDFQTVFDGRPFRLIGNFPYNISSQILIKAVDNVALVPEVVGMFQRELAERAAAKPGSKIYGALSVVVQAFYEVDYLFTVKPGSFTPPPKVFSGVIALKRRENYLDLGCDTRLFRTLVRASFGQRRKMLRNTMKPFLPKEVLFGDAFFQQRPEQLSLEDFISLTNIVDEHRS